MRTGVQGSWFTGGALLLLLLLCGSSALAQAAPEAGSAESAAEPDQAEQVRTLDDEARQRFELGRAFYDAGRFEQAAEEFAEAYRLSQRPQLLYNVYVAQRDAGKWPEATAALRSYLEQVPDAPDRINLRARLKTLETQAAAQAAASTSAPPPLPPPAPARPKRSVVPWVLIGSGAALLAASLATGLVAKSKDRELDRLCADGGNLCPSARREEANRAYGLAITTDLLWSTGAAAVVTGAVLRWSGILDRERTQREHANSVRAVSASVPRASAGLSFSRAGLSSSLTVRY